MTREDLFSVLRQIVIVSTGVPECILADPNAPSPTGDYAVIEPFDNLTDRGSQVVKYQEIQAVDGDVNFNDLNTKIFTHYLARVNINFYHGNARNYAMNLLQADKRPDVNEILFNSGIAWIRSDSINNLTFLNAGGQEPRSQIYIYVLFDGEQSVNVQQVYSIPYSQVDNDNNVITSGEVN